MRLGASPSRRHVVGAAKPPRWIGARAARVQHEQQPVGRANCGRNPCDGCDMNDTVIFELVADVQRAKESLFDP